MELSELFKKHSIEEIAKKTNIPKEKLESLRDKKWEDFRKPQVIGFLNIIQREFKVDLSTEIEEARDYFRQHNVDKAIASIDMVDSTVSSEHQGYFISKLIYLLTIIALAYAGWYYYTRETSPTIEIKENNNSVVSETIDGVKDLLGMNAKPIESMIKENEKNNSQKSASSTQQTNEQNEQANATSSLVKKENNTTEQTQKESKKEKEKFNFNYATTSQESTKSSEKNSTTLASQNQTAQKLEQNKTNEDNITLEQNQSEANITLAVEEENQTSQSEQNTTLFESATIIPHAKKLWVGTYNLDTKKRANKIINRDETIELDLTKGNYAVVTGHNKVVIKVGDIEKRFPKKGKVYLLLSKDEGLKVLTRKEYRKLTKNRAW